MGSEVHLIESNSIASLQTAYDNWKQAHRVHIVMASTMMGGQQNHPTYVLTIVYEPLVVVGPTATKG